MRGRAQAWAKTYRSGDSCADFFTTALQAADPDIPESAAVLEIGCAEFNWLKPARQAWPDLRLTGIDWRKGPDVEGVTTIQGDVRVQTFPEAFDCIVSISAIEHIGLGHYKKDPVDVDGDIVTLAKCWDWLKPGGWLYFDVPWNSGADAYQVVGTSHRVYDDAALRSRLHQGRPWMERWRGVVGTKFTTQLLTETPRLAGGDAFYYIGQWWQKPEAA